jgi:Mg2+/Co2+ transporter CorB
VGAAIARRRRSLSLILVFAEITPKVIGATYPERIALPSPAVADWSLLRLVTARGLVRQPVRQAPAVALRIPRRATETAPSS